MKKIEIKTNPQDASKVSSILDKNTLRCGGSNQRVLLYPRSTEDENMDILEEIERLLEDVDCEIKGI